jgi:lysophospholipase L1-like esterase
MVGQNPAAGSTFKDKDTEGWPGAIIDEVAAKMRISMPINRPNIATVLCGTNDMTRNIDVGNAPARMGKLIDDLLNFPPLTMVVVSSLPANANQQAQARINAYNAALPGVAQQRVNAGRWVLFADCGRSVGVNDLVDGTHPNDAAYERIGKCFYDAIVEGERRGWLAAVQGPAP